MTHIKIERVCVGNKEYYNAYQDCGLFSPLIHKWVLDRDHLNSREMIEYCYCWLQTKGVSIRTTVKVKKKRNMVNNKVKKGD